MQHYANVSINLNQIDRSYHYAIPTDLLDRLQPGALVKVPFNKQIVQGVVLDLIDHPEVANPLEVMELLSDDTVLTPAQLSLAQWLAQACAAPLGACISLMIPSGLSQRADLRVNKIADPQPGSAELSPIQKRILKLLNERGSLTATQLERALPKVNWRGSLSGLRRQGLVRMENYLPPPRVSSRMVRTLQLSIDPRSVPLVPDEVLGSRPETIRRRRAVLELLAAEPFPMDLAWIYAQSKASYSDLKVLEEAGLAHFNETEAWRDPLENIQAERSSPPQLTPDQRAVWQTIAPTLDGPAGSPFLLFGVTGSGKTEIYLKAVEKTLSQGKQALVMVPEIAMTPQAVRRFMARFPNQVGLYHHKLSEGERYDTWRRARQGDLKVLIGSRSALFVPLPDLGLIVLDECDHESYDETERLPYYHAVETAQALCQIQGAHLLLGSATPRVTQYHQAVQGDWQLLRLPRRVLAHRDSLMAWAAAQKISVPVPPEDQSVIDLELPEVQVVDMRRELREGNPEVLSRPLRQALREVLAANQQAILFLNRKGTASYVFCRECGFVLRCPRDDQPLAFHQVRSALLCHQCGYQRHMPEKCPNCGSRQIRQLGLGTEKLEELVKSAFPQARILRWDAETTAAKDAHEIILSHFSAHRADILIGTQMLAKGLDLPLVTLVGIVLAEVGLNLPDYRAAERTFQVLTQVSGRAGRGPLGGRVILQTYEPENYVIQAAAEQDFETFFTRELEARRALEYPPFTRLVRLEYRHLSEEKCEQTAHEMAALLREGAARLGQPQPNLIGPVPCYYRKTFGTFRWQIVLRSSDPLPLIRQLPLRDWRVEVDPPNLL